MELKDRKISLNNILSNALYLETWPIAPILSLMEEMDPI